MTESASAANAVFQPLRFRSLEVKNRVFRSSISGTRCFSRRLRI